MSIHAEPPERARPIGPDAARWPLAGVLPFAFVAGLAVTVVEFAAVRFFAPFFGQSNLIWTNIVGIVLFALAGGYLVGGRMADRRRSAGPLLGVVATAGLLLMLVPVIGVPLARAMVAEGFPAGTNLPLGFYGSMVGCFVLFAPPVALLGGVGPYLVRLAASPGGAGRASGQVFGVSTLGSILGCYVTTLWLVPGFGVRRTLWFAGGVLVLLAIVAACFVTRRSRILAVLGVAAVLSTFAYAAAIPADRLRLRDGALPGDTLLHEEESPYQTIRVIERQEPDPTNGGAPSPLRLLVLDEGDGEYHSVTLPGRVDTAGRYFDCLTVLPFMAGARSGPYRVLVVGFAAGSLYRGLADVLGPRLRLTGVELDPRIIDVAREHLGLSGGAAEGLEVVVEDGRAYVNSRPRSPTFDLVVVDAYTNQTYIPFQLASREFFETIRALLLPGGLLAVNVDCRTMRSPLVRTVAATVRAAGYPASWILPVPDYPSTLLLARPDDDRPLRVRSPVPLRWQRAARAFPRFLFGYRPTPDDLVLTDDHAPIERLTDLTLRWGDR